MNNTILLKPDHKIIDKIEWRLNVYFNERLSKEDGISLSNSDYEGYRDIILGHVKLDSETIDSLIYLCLQYSKAVDFAINHRDKLEQEINSKLKQAENYLKLLKLREILIQPNKSAGSIKLNKINFEYKEDGNEKSLEFDLPDILINNIDLSFNTNLAEKEFYESIIYFMTTQMHLYDVIYYRKQAARSLKMYCKYKCILEKDKVKNPAEQMRFIYSLLLHFNVFGQGHFMEKKESEGIISLLETPFKVKEHGVRSKIKKIKLPDLPEGFYDL